MGLLQGWGLLLGLVLGHSAGNKLVNFLLVDIVECHIAVAYEVVALLAGILRGNTVAFLQPGEHRLADMHSPVIDKGDLHHIVAAGLEKP